jgi:D-serine ammonia-lyase
METDLAEWAYPLPRAEQLKRVYIGKNLHDLPLPAAVIDRALVQRHCEQLLEACEALGIGFRAHVKSHKVINFQPH